LPEKKRLQYSNPEIPEGINYSREHPLKEFVVLVLGVLLLFLSLILVLGLLAEALAPYVPFKAELKIVTLSNIAAHDETLPVETYLQTLAERLAAVQDLPDGMSIRVHYVDSDSVNAFATLGGQIVVFRGLLEMIPDENALAMVLAHEIAHIKHRHPIKGLGRAVIIGTTVAMFNGAAGNDIVTDALGKAGLFTALKFSRDQEREADASALQALARVYGHVGGADELFYLLQQQHGGAALSSPEFFNTHPLTENRIDEIDVVARKYNWPTTGHMTILPQEFSQWMRQVEAEHDAPDVQGSLL
jgi:predicted Zn-dependent protease